MNYDAAALYRLLPAVQRIRDEAEGGPLKELLAVLAEQIAVVEENLEQLYDDQFIETCAEWVVPYIGDLIGYRPLYAVVPKMLSQRAEVAHTIALRRRKGTATVLEQLARDVTDWNARAVEFFQLLATTQYMNHRRPGNHYAPELRRGESLERIGTAFDTVAHTVDVRRIESGRGRYNIQNIGLFLWRLDAFRLRHSPAFGVDAERFMFSPLGHDMPLFTRPQTEDEITHLAGPLNVPEPISRRVLRAYTDLYYGENLSLLVEAEGVDTTPGNVQVCDLSDDGPGWNHLPLNSVSIDPLLGRIAFPAGSAPGNVRVMFHYGFSMAMGGGEYERQESFAIDTPPDQTVVQGQSVHNALNAVVAGGVVQIDDSGRYEETPAIAIDPDAAVELRAGNERRPTLVLGGDFEIRLAVNSAFTLNGLLLTGGTLRVPALPGTGPRLLRLRHCTLVPGLALTRQGEPVAPTGLSLVIEQPDTTVEIDASIVGAVRTVDSVTVNIANSIVDATAATAIAFSHPDGISAGGALTLEQVTAIGKVHARLLPLVSNSILLAGLSAGDTWPAPVMAERRQEGCVRFSFLPLEARTPRRYRCPPEDAADSESTPGFTTLRYGAPAYCQLAAHTPDTIRRGADDEGEMGAFHDLYQPQRETNLRIRLAEYLRVGLEAGIFYAT